MAKRKRYDEGGMTDDDVKSFAGTPENESTAGMKEAADAAAAEAKGEAELKAAPKQTFKEAFASARRAGDKTFEFGGKKYTTELASEKKAATKGSSTGSRVPVPEPVKPKASSGPKYQSLQDRAREYAAARAKSGVGMYGTRKSERSPLPTASDMAYKKGGTTASKRADGIAQRGKTRGKLY